MSGVPSVILATRVPSGGEFFFDAGDVFDGAVVGRLGGGFRRFARHVRRRDNVDLVTQVVEGEHAVEKHQHTVGNVEVVGGALADVFELAHDVIGAIADGAGGERRQAFHRRGTMLMQEFLDNVKNISGAAVDFLRGAAFDCDLGAARFQAQKRTHAEKRVAADFFSAFDRFEQESVGLSVGDGEKSGNRREQVGGDGLHHRNQRCASRHAQELFVAGTDHERVTPVCSIAQMGLLSQGLDGHAVVLLRVLANKRLHRFRHRDHQSHQIHRGWSEPAVFIELACPLGNCMYKDGTDAGYFGSLQRTQHGIAQEGRPDLSPLKIFVDGQPSNNHNRHGVGHVAPHAARRFRMGHGANRQGIVANYLPSGADHVGAGSAAFLVLQCAPAEPVVERRLSAGEFREIVFGAQILGRGQR